MTDSASKHALAATVRVTYDDGTVYTLDFVDLPDHPLEAGIGWNRPPIELPPTEPWRQFGPGPITFGEVHLAGVVTATQQRGGQTARDEGTADHVD